MADTYVHRVRRPPASTSASSTRSSSRRPARTWTRWSRCCSSWTSTRADDEELNAIFRCAHSVKGGAATFGFADVAELTHQMETLLDKLRRHELDRTTRDGRRAAGRRRRAEGAAGAPPGRRRRRRRHQRAARRHPRSWPRAARRRRGRRGGRAARQPRQPAAAAAAPRADGERAARADGRPAGATRPRRQPDRAVQGDRRASARSSRSTPATAADGMRRFRIVTDQHRQRPAGPVHVPRRARSAQARGR